MTIDERREKSRLYQQDYRARMTPERRDEVREKAKIERRKFRLEHKEEHQKYYLEWYRKHRDVLTARKRQWRKDNPERHRIVRSAYSKINRESLNEAARIYRRNHPGFSTKQVHAWKEKYPERYYLSNANARAKRKQQGEGSWKVSCDQLSQFMSAQNGCCYYCEKSLLDGFHLEHKTPLSKGGLHVFENLCLSCPHCNQRKHNKTEIEFRSYLAKER